MVWFVPGQRIAHHTRDVSIGLYLGPAQGTCVQLPLEGCVEDVQRSGRLLISYYAVLAALNGGLKEGIAGISCGIDYDGLTGTCVQMVSSFPTETGRRPAPETELHGSSWQKELGG